MLYLICTLAALQKSTKTIVDKFRRMHRLWHPKFCPYLRTHRFSMKINRLSKRPHFPAYMVVAEPIPKNFYFVWKVTESNHQRPHPPPPICAYNIPIHLFKHLHYSHTMFDPSKKKKKNQILYIKIWRTRGHNKKRGRLHKKNTKGHVDITQKLHTQTHKYTHPFKK